MAKPSKIPVIEQKFGKPIKQVLREQYKIHGNQISVAAALEIGQATLSQWLVRLDLEEKTIIVPRRKHTQN